MKTKNRKLKWLAIGSLALATAVALPITISASGNRPKVVYQNRIYDSLNEAVAAYLKDRASAITTRRVIGDVSEEISDAKFNILNKARLYDYDPARISPAYITRYGTLTHDPLVAVSGQASPTNAITQYTFPGALENYATQAEAEAARDAVVQAQTLALARISDPTKSGTNSSLYFNPTNKDDLQELKRLALSAVTKNKNSALRAIENNYDQTLSNKDLGNGWSIKPYYQVDNSGNSYRAIDGISGNQLGSTLDFSQLSTQMTWLRNALPANYLSSNNNFGSSNVKLDLSGDKPVLKGSFTFWVDKSSPDNPRPYFEYTTTDDYYESNTEPIDWIEGASYSVGNGNNVARYNFNEPILPISSDKNLVQSGYHRVLPADNTAKDFVNTDWVEGNNPRQFSLTDLLNNNVGERRYGFAPIKLSSWSSPGTAISVDAAIGRGMGKTLREFVAAFRGTNSVSSNRLDLQKLLGTTLKGTAGRIDPGFVDATLSNSVTNKISLTSNTRFVFYHEFNRRNTDFPYYRHLLASNAVENVNFELPLESLFNTAFAGNELYQVRLDLARQENKLINVLSYQNTPLFKVSEDASENVTLANLPYAQQNEKDLTLNQAALANTPAAQLASLVTSIDQATTPLAKIEQLIRSEDIIVESVSTVQEAARLKSNAFSFNGEGIKPYLQYLSAFKKLLKSVDSSGLTTEQANVRKVWLWENIFLARSEFFAFNQIDYFANVVARASFNLSTLGLRVPEQLVAYRLSPAEYTLKLEQIKKWTVPAISTVVVFYDADGQPVLLKTNASPFDNSLYDSLALMRENILRQYPLRISKDYFFYRDDKNRQLQIRSQISTIYEFNTGSGLLYFSTFADLERYATDQVNTNSTLLEG